MSTVKTNNVQIGQSVTATNNFTWYQPATPDGTVRLGNGNSGSVTDLVTLTSAGNLGIGTSSPSQKLDVAGYVKATGANKGVLFGENGCAITGTSATYAAANMQFWTADTVRATLDSSGNLGLGVTPSAWSAGKAIEIGNAGDGLSINYGAGLNLNRNAYYNGGFKYGSTDYASRYAQASGQHQWYTAPSGTAGNAISFTQAMTLTAGGILLIGQSAGSMSVQGILLEPYGTGRFVTNNGADNVCMYLNRIASDGSIEIFQRNSTTVGSISVTTSATAYNTSSDQRLKTNITPAGSAIQSILDFPVDQFDWISSGEHQEFGAVAQKAINVIPEMVSVPADPDEMWGIDWSKAVPRLIKTIQELSAELNELKKRVG